MGHQNIVLGEVVAGCNDIACGWSKRWGSKQREIGTFGQADIQAKSVSTIQVRGLVILSVALLECRNINALFERVAGVIKQGTLSPIAGEPDTIIQRTNGVYDLVNCHYICRLLKF